MPSEMAFVEMENNTYLLAVNMAEKCINVLKVHDDGKLTAVNIVTHVDEGKIALRDIKDIQVAPNGPYVYVSLSYDDMIVALEVKENGNLEEIGIYKNGIGWGFSLLSIDGASGMKTFMLEGHPFLGVVSFHSGSLIVIPINFDGSLNVDLLVAKRKDIDTVLTDISKIGLITSSGKTYLLTAAYAATVATIYSVTRGSTGKASLSYEGVISDNDSYGNIPASLFEINSIEDFEYTPSYDKKFLITSQYASDNLIVFEVVGAGGNSAGGALKYASHINLATPTDIEIANIDGTTYLFVLDVVAGAVNVLSLSTNGSLSLESKLSINQLNTLKSVHEAIYREINGGHYLYVTARDSGTLNVLTFDKALKELAYSSHLDSSLPDPSVNGLIDLEGMTAGEKNYVAAGADDALFLLEITDRGDYKIVDSKENEEDGNLLDVSFVKTLNINAKDVLISAASGDYGNGIANMSSWIVNNGSLMKVSEINSPGYYGFDLSDFNSFDHFESFGKHYLILSSYQGEIASFRLSNSYQLTKLAAIDQLVELPYYLVGVTGVALKNITYLYLASPDEGGKIEKYIFRESEILIKSDEKPFSVPNIEEMIHVKIDDNDYLVATTDVSLHLIRIDPTSGVLSLIDTLYDYEDNDLTLNNAKSITPFTIFDKFFVAVISENENGVSIFQIEDSKITFLMSYQNDSQVGIANAISITYSAKSISEGFFSITGRNKDGISSFQFEGIFR